MDGDIANKILVVVVSLIILAIGIFAITVLTTTTDMEADRIETYAVADPSVDLVVNVTYTPSVKPTVEQFNGILWAAVDPADVEWNGFRQVIVENEGMQG